MRPASATAWPDLTAYVLDADIGASAIIHDAALAAGTPVVWIRTVDALCFEENISGRTGTFSVERDAGIASPLTVYYSISGTATNGVDYVTLPGTVTIPSGSPRIAIVIDPIFDTIAETGETVGITINPPPLSVSPPTYVVGSSFIRYRSAGITIHDLRPFDPRARAFYARRGRHTIIPLPIAPAPAPPATALAAAAAPALWSVEATTDLINWETIGTTDPSGEQGDFVDVDAGNFDQRFYRFRPVTTITP